MPGAQGRFRGVLEEDGLAGHAQEVLVVVHRLAGGVHHAAVHGGVQGHAQRLAGQAGELAGEIAHNGIKHAGVSRALDLQFAGELLLGLKCTNQHVDRLCGPAHSGHAGSGIDRGLHALGLGVGAHGLGKLLAPELDDGHRTLGIGAGDLLHALVHQTGTVARDAHGLFTR